MGRSIEQNFVGVMGELWEFFDCYKRKCLQTTDLKLNQKMRSKKQRSGVLFGVLPDSTPQIKGRSFSSPQETEDG
jgi:hypothetical protein